MRLLACYVLLQWSAVCLAELASDDPHVRFNCGTKSPVSVAKGFQGRFTSPGYPNKYTAGSDCLFQLVTTADAKFTMTCDLAVPCPDSISVSPSGDPYFSDAPTPSCGTGILQMDSKTNGIAVRLYAQANSQGGVFNCTARAIAADPLPTTTPAPTCNCGIKGSNRIVNGEIAGEKEWPWQVMLTDNTAYGGGEQLCGGTLISPSFVVTAAHCTYNRQAKDIGIIVGQFHRDFLEPTAQVRGVAKIIQHPQFDRRTVDNDISLIQLDSPVKYADNVKPVCLPARYVSSDFSGQIGVATGWGTTSYGGPSSDVLLKVSLPIISTKNCKTNPNIGSKITDNMFCTYADGKDACQGDSGGPLNWQASNGRVYLLGVTSFSIGCAKANTPGVYAKVTNYLPWIQQYTGSLCTV